MEEFLCKGYTYKFHMRKIDNDDRVFTANFVSIESPSNTLIVENYSDASYGTVPGTRSMPFNWIKNITLMDTNELEVIELSSYPHDKKNIIYKKKKFNNYMN